MSREPSGNSAIERLLAAERDEPAPEASLARVWSRVSASVAPAAGLFAPTPLPPRTVSGVIRKYPLAAISTALLVGSMIGGSAVAWGLRGSPVATHVGAAAPSASPAPAPAAPQTTRSVASVLAPAAPLAAVPLRATPSSGASVPSLGTHRPSTSSVSSLAEERALLDGARAALGAGDGERALAITETHQRRFSRPQLAEEREAIAIQALVVAGRFGDARARAARFRENTPDSLFAPAVEASLASISR